MKNMTTNHLLKTLCLITSVIGFSTQTLANSPPYDNNIYQSVLNDSKLQAPTSNTLISQGNFKDKHNQYFYTPSNGNPWMTFKVSGSSKRSELRQMNEWYVGDPGLLHKMIGQVLVDNPSSGSVDEITFMQAHDVTGNSNAINKPLVRLVWLAERNGISNHYWAIVKKDACENCSNYEKVDLGAHSASTATKFEIRIKDSKLTIKVNNTANTLINNYNISYWDDLESYFKAGVYNQDSGTGTVQFKSLKYYEQPY